MNEGRAIDKTSETPIGKAMGEVSMSIDTVVKTLNELENRIDRILSPEVAQPMPAGFPGQHATDRPPPMPHCMMADELADFNRRLNNLRNRLATLLGRVEL